MYSDWVTADTDPFRSPSGWLGLGLGHREPPQLQGLLGVPCWQQPLPQRPRSRKARKHLKLLRSSTTRVLSTEYGTLYSELNVSTFCLLGSPRCPPHPLIFSVREGKRSQGKSRLLQSQNQRHASSNCNPDSLFHPS